MDQKLIAMKILQPFKMFMKMSIEEMDKLEVKVGKEVVEKPKLSVKLLIDKKAKRVIFAEADKGFIDTLINFLFIAFVQPVTRSAVRLLINKEEYVGILNLYESIYCLDDSHFLKPNKVKAMLGPESQYDVNSFESFPNFTPTDPSGPLFFMCDSYHCYVSDDPSALCPTCKHSFGLLVPYVSGTANYKEEPSGDTNYVKGDITYMVMDNLKVIPMSTISIITVVNKVNSIKDVHSLEEKVVYLDVHQVNELMKISAESKTTLTDFFLKKPARRT